ncbi:MAG: hypothetical protein AAF990_16765 [Bacteroidota bacterium]
MFKKNVNVLFFSLLLLGGCKVVQYDYAPSSGRQGVFVKDFYNEGDPDWTNAIEKAIAYAEKSGSRIVEFENGVYTISRGITVGKDIDIKGQSINNTILKAKPGGQYKEAIIRFGGGKSEPTNLKLRRDIVCYDRELEFTTAPNFKQGDVLIIASKKADSWNKGFVKGEYLKVQEVVGRKLLIFGQTYDDYKGSEVVIYRYEGTQSSISNMTIIGDPTQLKACIRMEKGLNNNFSNLIVKGSNYAGIITILGYNQSFSNIRAEKTTNDQGNGLSYGINIGNSQNVKLINCNLYGVRHALTFGGAGSIKIPNRFNTCMNSTLASRINYAASFHPNSQSCGYINCDIFGGVGIRGKNHKVDNCNIYNLYDEQEHTHMHSITFYQNTFDLNHEITNNNIFCRKRTNELVVNYQDGKSPYFKGGSLRFSGNRIVITQKDRLSKPSPVINFNFNNTDEYSKVIFTNNIIETDNPMHIFQCRSFTNKNFHYLLVNDNEFGMTGVFIQNINQFNFRNNNMEGFQRNALHIQQLKDGENDNEFIVIDGNTIQRCGKQAFIYERFKGKTSRMIVRNNVFTENLSVTAQNRAGSNMSISNVESCYVQNNVIGSESAKHQKQQSIFKNIDRFQSGNNIWLGKGKLKVEAREKLKLD